MRELTIEEVHEADLAMLVALDRFCMKHGLTYFLAYGTLLGALRHGGFIPWDDDADVVMPRSDMEWLVANWSTDSSTEYIRVLEPCADRYSFGWAKLYDTRTYYKNPRASLPDEYGLAIDIFPLDDDRGPVIDKLVRLQSLARGFERGVFATSSKRPGLLGLAEGWAKRLLSIIPDAWCNRGAQARLLKLGRLRTGRVVNHFSPYGYEKESQPSSYYGKTDRMDFETTVLSVPADAPAILERFYTDWMTPVVNPRHARFFWRDA